MVLPLVDPADTAPGRALNGACRHPRGGARDMPQDSI